MKGNVSFYHVNLVSRITGEYICIYKVPLRNVCNVKSRGRRKAKRESQVTHVTCYSWNEKLGMSHTHVLHTMERLSERAGGRWTIARLVTDRPSYRIHTTTGTHIPTHYTHTRTRTCSKRPFYTVLVPGARATYPCGR